MGTRIYLLSKKLGISNRELMDLLRSRGFEVSSPSSTVADLYVDDLVREFGTGEGAGKAPATVGTFTPVAGREEGAFPIAANARVGENVPAATRTFPNETSFVKKEEANSQDGQRDGTKSPFPLLLKPKIPPNAERPKMIPLARIQSSVQAQSNRFSGRPIHERRPFPERKTGEFRPPGGGGGNFSPRGPGGFRPTGPFPREGTGNFVRREGGWPAQRDGQSFRSGREFPGSARWASAGGDRLAAPRIPAPIPDGLRPSSGFSFPRRPETTESQGAGSPGGGSVVAPRQKEQPVTIKFPISVRDFAPELGLKPFQLISELMKMGTFASMNYLLDEPLAKKIGAQFGFRVEAKAAAVPRVPSPAARAKKEVAHAILEPRPPIVCVLGHVDHGKTTLLDAIRKTNVVAGEAGGITQHIGAYEVESNGRKITFIDTPGHAAFSKMRERGANLTDVAVLVVAADDGFMPQTDEALKFAQRAGVPVVVAINKMDAKGANVDRVKQQMQQRSITAEDWGGETLCAPISAINGDGIPELLELILVQAEILGLQADPRGPVQGVVVESQIEMGRGPMASVIIQEGTLRVGHALLCGNEYCKVRALIDDRGISLKSAQPAKPVRIMGWSGPLDTGAIFIQEEDEKIARAKAEENRVLWERQRNLEENGENTPPIRGRNREGRANDSENLEAIFAAIHAKKKKILRVIVRADVQGSCEALAACLEALPQGKIGLEIMRCEVGPVSKGDVEFAASSESTIVAFHSKVESGVPALLKQHGVSLIQHNIIYELVDRVRDAMADLLDPELLEEKLGAAQIRQVFKLSKATVGGCMVTEGKISRDAQVRLFRDGKQILLGKIASMRREKEEVVEVRAGYECGISLAGCSDYQVGDTITCFKIVKIRPSL